MLAHYQCCKTCEWQDEIFVEPFENPPCPKCGGETERLWIGSSAAVIDDTIIGGMVVENLAPDPITFYSKSEHKRYLKEHGFVQKVRHVGEEGSDKSQHTTRWV
ncbi:MAG: hypothetical protein ACOYD0_11880 [Candidatus Nanopelagicales bacterium]